jgi:hypothetical protein
LRQQRRREVQVWWTRLVQSNSVISHDGEWFDRDGCIVDVSHLTLETLGR